MADRSQQLGGIIRLDEGTLQSLLKKLGTLPERVQVRVLRSAGRKATTVILNQAKARTPRAAKKAKKYANKPHLRDVLTFKQKTYGRGDKQRTVFVIGPQSGAAPHAHLVEHGTGERFTNSQTRYATITQGKIKTKSGWRFRKKKVSVGSFIKRPGGVRLRRGRMPAFRMMQKAMQSSAQLAQRSMESEIRAGIEREARG